MKKLHYLFFLCLLTLAQVHAHNSIIKNDKACINCPTDTPDASAVLEIQSSNKGILIPRVASITSISSPATGLMIYDNSSNSFKYYDGTDWQDFGGSVEHIIFSNDANSFVGVNAGNSNTGNQNTAFGSAALYNNIDRSGLVAVGDSALFNNGVGAISSFQGTGNTALGSKTLYSNTRGYSNTAVGSRALNANTTGFGNVAVGRSALASNVTSNINTAIGFSALASNTTGSSNIAIGYNALRDNINGVQNVAGGSSALSFNTTGNYNVAIGYNTLRDNTTGSGNTANGHQALTNNTTGNSNVAIGTRTLLYNTNRSNLVAVGDSALYNNGRFVTLSFHAQQNTALGSKALYNNTTGFYNVSGGFSALYSNTIGAYNSAFGWKALYNNTMGEYNTAIGLNSLLNNTSGNFNTAVGYNTFTTINQYTNSAALGNNAQPNASNRIRLGNSSITQIGGYANWSNVSDKRFKTKIKADVPGLAFINELRPVTYQMDMDAIAKFHKTPDSLRLLKAEAEKGAIRYTGFLAQEVEAAAEQIGYDFSGVDQPAHENDNYSLRYAEFVVPLVKAIQEQQAIIEEKDEKIANLEARLAKIEALLFDEDKKKSTTSTHHTKLNTAAQLLDNQPNPFSESTTLHYFIPENVKT
ncbi:MAG: tail fiber domain-containing protein, partial [Bacteroidota bacterium]